MAITSIRFPLAGLLLFAMLSMLMLSAGQPAKTGPATEKRFPPLKVPAEFKATLFACDPLIEYPSVISIGPKPGAIFVAIDYMTGLVRDGKVKSEIRLVEDTDGDGYADKATRIAGDFNSIQGLAYHEGSLYVMHAPFLTVLREKDQGQPSLGFGDRKDLLTGLGLDPKDNRSRLHCANAVVIGHDGWLYLALGDNGVNVPRPEGDQLVYHGGGILRCRPDGRDLHVFSTGLRNIYDIALDADLNVFTRDNENDGGTYMIRVCHCFHGSDHGYPYDYEERPDYAMKPIGDFGLGSSAGGVCYLETQFPKEYRGNLFFCEWGKSLVRYELKRAGSGFAPVKEIEFATGDPKDSYPFKPTDVVVQSDGTMMVADYADGQEPKRGRGRIYHIKYVGKKNDGPNKKLDTPLQQLDSPSYHERCEAQRAFERKGQKGRDELGDALRNGKVSPIGYRHALWAVVRIGGDKALDDMLMNAKFAGVVDLRLQAIRAAADLADPILVKHKLDAGRGDVKVAEFLANLPERDDPRILLEIAIALGRLRWEGAPDWLAQNIKKPDAALAHATMQTLCRADNWPAVVKLLDKPDRDAIRAIALRAVSDQYENVVVDGLIERLRNDKDASRQREYAVALSRVYKKPAAWKYWGYRPGPRPANTVAWQRTDAIAKALDDALRDPDRDARAAVLKRMQREKVPVNVETLGGWLADDYDPARAAIIIDLLAGQPKGAGLKYLYRTIMTRQHADVNRLAALDSYFKDYGDSKVLSRDLEALAGDLGPDRGPVLAEVVRRRGRIPDGAPASFFVRYLDSTSAELRAAAIEALGNQGLKEGLEPAVFMLDERDVRVRRAAADAAGKLVAKKATERLLDLASDRDVGVRRACLESLLLLREPRVVPHAVTALNERELQAPALACLATLGGPAQQAAVVKLAHDAPSSDISSTVVRALTGWRDRKLTTAAERQTLERAIAQVHGDSGIVTRWDASGPINDAGLAAKIVALNAKKGNLPTDWRPHFAAGAEGRLVLAAKDAGKDVRYFAHTEVITSAATDVEFLASSRGSLQVWLNGKSIYRRDQPRNFQIDSDRFAAALAPGLNRILIETGSSSTGAEFHLRFRRKSSKAAHEKLTLAALSRNGNADRGRKVFFDKDKSQCIKCHQIGNQGERIGPELTGVGARFSRIYLVESILEPSRTIAPSFGTFAVTLKNGKTLNGIKVAEDEKTLTLADNQGQKHALAKADIDEQNPVAVSTMPDGLEGRLTEDEFVDLIAFLANQKK